jgi:hypothetical protein
MLPSEGLPPLSSLLQPPLPFLHPRSGYPGPVLSRGQVVQRRVKPAAVVVVDPATDDLPRLPPFRRASSRRTSASVFALCWDRWLATTAPVRAMMQRAARNRFRFLIQPCRAEDRSSSPLPLPQEPPAGRPPQGVPGGAPLLLFPTIRLPLHPRFPFSERISRFRNELPVFGMGLSWILLRETPYPLLLRPSFRDSSRRSRPAPAPLATVSWPGA